MLFSWTNISAPSKEGPTDKLDIILNPEKAKQRKEEKKMAMDDLRGGRQSIVAFE